MKTRLTIKGVLTIATILILSIMALGSSTLVSEANGGLSKIDASVLDTPDIDTRMRRRAVQKGVGATRNSLWYECGWVTHHQG